MGDVIHLSRFFRSVYVVPPQTPCSPKDNACVKHAFFTGQPSQIFLAFALSWKNHFLHDSGISRQAASAKTGEGLKNSNLFLLGDEFTTYRTDCRWCSQVVNGPLKEFDLIPSETENIPVAFLA